MMMKMGRISQNSGRFHVSFSSSSSAFRADDDGFPRRRKRQRPGYGVRPHDAIGVSLERMRFTAAAARLGLP